MDEPAALAVSAAACLRKSAADLHRKHTYVSLLGLCSMSPGTANHNSF